MIHARRILSVGGIQQQTLSRVFCYRTHSTSATGCPPQSLSLSVLAEQSRQNQDQAITRFYS
jgi:hypothetical protein